MENTPTETPLLEDVHSLRFPEETRLEWFVCDNEDLPPKSTLESRRQWYHDGNQVKADLSWEKRLMPAHCIRNRHIDAINRDLDAALNDDSKTAKDALRLQREKEICKTWGEQEWYEQALKNLDKRVASGEPDKPLIRAALNQKISEHAEKAGN